MKQIRFGADFSKGAAYARKNPDISAIMGIVFALFLIVVFYVNGLYVGVALAALYLIYCVYLLVKEIKAHDPSKQPGQSEKQEK